jgi:hypothetical protein
MAEEEKKQEFDTKVMLEGFRKAIEVRDFLKSKGIELSQNDLKDVATTFFEQSMANVLENRKRKQQEGSW